MCTVFFGCLKCNCIYIPAACIPCICGNDSNDAYFTHNELLCPLFLSLFCCTAWFYIYKRDVGCVGMCECTDYQIIHKKVTHERAHESAVGTAFM